MRNATLKRVRLCRSTMTLKASWFPARTCWTAAASIAAIRTLRLCPGQNVRKKEFAPSFLKIPAAAADVTASNASMKAIQIKRTGGPEVMEYVDLPVPTPKANEAVVEIRAAGVNFIDVYHREGRYPVQLPFVPGQEGAGVISAVGPEVKNVKVGDRVASAGMQGSYAEFASAPAEKLVRIPDKLDFEEAA